MKLGKLEDAVPVLLLCAKQSKTAERVLKVLPNFTPSYAKSDAGFWVPASCGRYAVHLLT